MLGLWAKGILCGCHPDILPQLRRVHDSPMWWRCSFNDEAVVTGRFYLEASYCIIVKDENIHTALFSFSSLLVYPSMFKPLLLFIRVLQVKVRTFQCKPVLRFSLSFLENGNMFFSPIRSFLLFVQHILLWTVPIFLQFSFHIKKRVCIECVEIQLYCKLYLLNYVKQSASLSN